MATPTLLYGCEASVRRKKEENRIQARKIRFFRAVNDIPGNLNKKLKHK
jgi:hypothetical protein